jgi:hypothetical protein
MSVGAPGRLIALCSADSTGNVVQRLFPRRPNSCTFWLGSPVSAATCGSRSRPFDRAVYKTTEPQPQVTADTGTYGNSHKRLTDLLTEDRELSSLVTLWPTLPPSIRQNLLAIATALAAQAPPDPTVAPEPETDEQQLDR